MNKPQHRNFRLSAVPQIFFTAAAIGILFVAFAIPFHREFASFFGQLGGFTFRRLGWLYVLSVSSLLIFLLWLAASRYGDIKLGQDHEPPAYSTGAWFVMLFAAGIGTVLMFWGVAEPLSHFHKPPLLEVVPETRAAAKTAMNIALYHFGLHTWTIFIVPAVALGYFSYRRGLPMRISSVFYPVLREKIYGPWGWTIDVIALLGTLFGVAVSLGLGTLQLTTGLQQVLGTPRAEWLQMLVLALITGIATISVALGLDRGIKTLSYINIAIALLLLAFIASLGPSQFILAGTVQNIGSYLQNLPWMSFWTEAYQGTSWQRSWTVFYWAWTISWAPYIGLFIAHISRGRSIRQVILGGLGAPLAFTLIWFSVFGLSAIDLEMHHQVDLYTQVEQNVAVALFSFLEHFPLSLITSLLSLVIIVIFLTTSADSAALVMDLLTRHQDQPSHTWQRVFWMLLMGTLSASLLLGGGLPALQNVITSLGFPFCLLLIFMAVVLVAALKEEVDQKKQKVQAPK